MTGSGVSYKLQPAFVQALLLSEVGVMPRVRYGLVRFHAPERTADTKAWLRGILPHVHDMAAFTVAHRWHVNVAFTYAGLQALGVGYEPMPRPNQDHDSFTTGLHGRATFLGEVGESAPANWRGFAQPAVAPTHALVWVSGRDAAATDEGFAVVFGTPHPAAGDEFPGGTFVEVVDAGHLDDGFSHFGFADGISQPFIREVHDHPALAPNGPTVEGSGVYDNDGQWRPVELGEFLLGYPGEDVPDTTTSWSYPGPFAHGPGLKREWLQNGTFVVWRQLEQHVDRFLQFLESNAGEYATLMGWTVERATEELAARVIGRYPFRVPERAGDGITFRYVDDPRSGRPLTTDLDGRFDEYGADHNRFRYGEFDGAGRLCPFGAHMRRANPRDGMGQPRLSSRHRIVRRSYPYGSMDWSQEHGLIFVAICASIEDQYEFVKRDWMNDGRPFDEGMDADVIGGVFVPGDEPRKLIIGGEQAFLAILERPLLTTRGGGYFFAPSLPSLHALVALV